jgi:hypothetical protein
MPGSAAYKQVVVACESSNESSKQRILAAGHELTLATASMSEGAAEMLDFHTFLHPYMILPWGS